MRKMWNCESKAVNFFKTSQMDLNWVRGFNQQREQFELTAKLSDLVSADIKSPVKLSELLNRFKGQLSFLKSKLDRLPGKASAEQLAYSSQLGKIISEIEKNSQKIGTELTKFLKSLPPEKSLMAKIGEGLLAVPLAIFSAGCTPTNKPALTEKEQMILGGLVMMGQANRQNTGAGQTPSTTPVTVPSQPTDTPLITPATPAATVTPPVTPVTPVDITFPPNPVTYRLDNQGRKVSAMIRHYVNGEPRMAVYGIVRDRYNNADSGGFFSVDDAFGSTNSDLKGNVMLSEIYLSDISSEAQNRGIYYPFTSRSFESVLTLLSSATEDDLKAFISEEVLDLTNPGTLYSRLEHDFLNTTANSKNYFLYFSSVYNTESNLTLGTLSPNTKINEGVFCVGGAIVKKNSQMLSYTWAIFKSEDKWLIASIARTVQNPSSEQQDWKYDDSVLKNLKEISKDKNPDAIIYEGMNKNLGLKWIMDQLGLVEADFVYP